MKRGVAVTFVFILLVLSFLAHAKITTTPQADGSTITDYSEATPAEISQLSGAQLQDAIKQFDSWPADAKRALSADQIGSNFDALKGKEGELDPAAYSDAASKQIGTVATIDTSAGDVGGSVVGNGMHFDSLPNAKFNDVVLTNAHDVVVNRDSTCGKGAEAVLLGAAFHGNVNEFCVTGKRIDIKHADEVMIPSNGNVWSTHNINSATLIINDRVHVTSHIAQTVAVRDFASHDLKLTFQQDSSASFAKDASDITLDATTAELSNNGDFISTEIADGSNNGSARLVLDRLTKKVLYVEMNPVFSYVLKTGKVETDFAFRAQDNAGKLFIRRTIDQIIPIEFTTCQNCGVIDLPDRMLTIRGNLDYLRKGATDTFITTIHSSNSASLVKLKMDPTFTFIAEESIIGDNPEVTTRISNYLTVTERTVGDETHRLLRISEKTTPGLLQQNLVWNYKTSYSASSMKIADNNLHYERGTLNLDVLSPANPGLDDLWQGLRGIHAALLGGLILLVPRSKKGQVTVFIMLGVVMVIGLSLVVFTSGATSRSIADNAGINSYMRACVEQSSKDALTFTGSQGGTTTAPIAFWFDGVPKTQSTADVERVLSAELHKRTQRCMDSLDSKFQGIERVEQASIDARAIINKKSVLFTVKAPATIVLRDGVQFTLSDQSTEQGNTLSQTIALANATVTSEALNDGMIDLDAYDGESVTLTFFPHDNKLITFIRDEGYAVRGTTYQFAFGSSR